MVKIIAVSNQKGGVGKTTVAVNLAGVLAEKDRRVLLLDMDSQGNTTSFFNPESPSLNCTTFDLVTGDDVSVQEVIQRTGFYNLDLIPGSIKLKAIDSHFAGDWDAQYILKEKLEPCKKTYDYILIDCPPSLGLSTLSSYICADFVLVPIEAQEWAFKGLIQTNIVVNKIKKRLNPQLKILGYVVNKYNSRRNLENTYVNQLKESYDGLVFKNLIKVSVKYPEAVILKKPINSYLPNSEQAEIFRKIAAEVEKRCQES